MFTGIIETLGKVSKLEKKGGNLQLTIDSPISNELKIDQSISHNGVCLTVINCNNNSHTVEAIEETLAKTSLSELKEGAEVNLERCLKADGRFDGHIVQGHVDEVGECTHIDEKDGSWIFTFIYDTSSNNITVEKGSICVNGISLTVVDSKDCEFSVAIIPYTFEHTNFRNIRVGDRVNLEFDIVGKYIAKLT